jgi:uncharacterized FAD-dependent dehydrogenase
MTLNNFYQKISNFFKEKNSIYKEVDRITINPNQFQETLKQIPAKNFKFISTGKNLLSDLELKIQKKVFEEL